MATTTTEQQSQLVQTLLSGGGTNALKGHITNPPKLPANQISPFDPAQIAGQNQALSAAGTQQQLAQGGKGFTDFAFGAMLDPQSNPYLLSTMDAATRPFVEQFNEEVLPNLRNDFVSAGGYGGSRQDLAEERRLKILADQVADTRAEIGNEAYQTAQDTAVKTLGFLPQTSVAQTLPALTTSGVGDVRQGQEQRTLDSSNFRTLYNQVSPFISASEALGTASSLGGGGTTVTGTPVNTTGAQQAVNSGGSSIGGTLTSILGGAGVGFGVGGPIGAVIGGGLGLLSSFF